MKVAITTWWHYHNYGSALQALATQNLLKGFGHDPSIVKYIPEGKRYATSKQADLEHEENWQKYPRNVDDIREKKFEKFLVDNLSFTRPVDDDDSFLKLNDEYDVFVTGSDQIWAPSVFDERYYLDFVKDNRKKIAYAPSIGLPKIENDYVRGRMRDLVSQFGHVSVREKQGLKLLNDDLGIEHAEVLPDPTLLLTYREWRKLIPEVETKNEDDYILCYFLGENDNAWLHALAAAKQTGYRIKTIPVLQKDEKYGEIIKGVGPSEFFNLIDGAKIVLTDSFHGAIFSIITETPFYVFERFRPESDGSQNSRIYNLLDMAGLSDRLIGYNEGIMTEYAQHIDFKKVGRAISQQRERAKEWLSSALHEVFKIKMVKYDALITYYSHSLEKSLSNPNFEHGHAFGVVKEMVNIVRQYKDLSLDRNSPAYISALSTLGEFYRHHMGTEYQSKVEQLIFDVMNEVMENKYSIGGALTIDRLEKVNNASKNFKELSEGRHSIRSYSSKEVDENDIIEAIEIAQNSPSACNRQQARVYYMTDKEIINQVLLRQGTLNDYPVPPLLFLITATDDAYIFDTENNNGFIDGSLFAMSLLYALEYKGIAACPLHAMFDDRTRREMMKLLGIPENEKLIFFISAGYFGDNSKACKSFRYSSDYITRKITRITHSFESNTMSKSEDESVEMEIQLLRDDNEMLRNSLNSFLSTRRSLKLLLGNVKRHYSRGLLGKIKRKLRLRTRLKVAKASARDVVRSVYWALKDARVAVDVRRIVKRQLREGDKIPKVIHYIWVGGAKKPESVERYIESWRKYCPDYEIIEWSEKNYNVKKNRYMREAYEAKKWAFVTDYMRLDILDHFGGIYMDSDVEVLKSLDQFLCEPAFSSFEAGDPSQIFLPTGMMASEKKGNWIKYLKSYYSRDRSFYLADGQIDTTPNTTTITRMTVDKYGVLLNNKLQRTTDFTMYPSDYFCPKSWSTRKINITKNSHTVHHFAASWLPSEVREKHRSQEEER